MLTYQVYVTIALLPCFLLSCAMIGISIGLLCSYLAMLIVQPLKFFKKIAKKIFSR